MEILTFILLLGLLIFAFIHSKGKELEILDLQNETSKLQTECIKDLIETIRTLETRVRELEIKKVNRKIDRLKIIGKTL